MQVVQLQNKGDVVGVILLLCVIIFFVLAVKNGQNRCTFTEVIAKIKQGYRFWTTRYNVEKNCRKYNKHYCTCYHNR